VIISSPYDGSATALGWLWTRITAVAFRASAIVLTPRVDRRAFERALKELLVRDQAVAVVEKQDAEPLERQRCVAKLQGSPARPVSRSALARRGGSASAR